MEMVGAVSGGGIQNTIVGTTSGRSLVIGIGWNDITATITSITIDNESNATLISGSLITNAVLGLRHQFAYLGEQVANGDKLVRINFSADFSTAYFFVQEYSGGNLSSFFDAAGTNTGVSGSLSATVTTGSSGELIVGIGVTNGSSLTVGADYSALTDGSFNNAFWFDRAEDDLDAGAAGSKTVDFSAGSGTWDVTAVAFKPSGAAEPQSLNMGQFWM